MSSQSNLSTSRPMDPWLGLLKLLLLGNASRKTLLVCVLLSLPSLLLMFGASRLGLADVYVFLGYAILVMASVVWVMAVAIKAASIIVNSQLFLVDLRGHLFLVLLGFNVLLSAYLTGPVNMFGHSIIWAKLVAFIYFSSATIGFIWLRCLALLSFIVSIALCAVAILLVGFELCTKLQGALLFCVMIWGYFFYWLQSSGLQRSFKYQNFSGPVDFLIEKLKVRNLRTLTQVKRNPNIVILSGMSDGLINRYVLSGFFGVLFVVLYIMVVNTFGYSFTIAWAIAMIFSIRAKYSTSLSVRKRHLWMLLNGGRQELFSVLEKQLIKDVLVAFLIVGLLIICKFNTEKLPMNFQMGIFLVCALSFITALYLDMTASKKASAKYRLAAVVAGLTLMMVVPFVVMFSGLSLESILAIALGMSFVLMGSRHYAKSRILNGDI